MWRLFLDRWRETPHAPAVVDGELVATFQQLLSRVQQISFQVDSWHVPETHLGICFERPSLSAIVALLVAIRLERPYVPLHPVNSSGLGSAGQRLATLMSLANIGGVLCSGQTKDQVTCWHPMDIFGLFGDEVLEQIHIITIGS